MGSRRPSQMTFRSVLTLCGEALEDRFPKTHRVENLKAAGDGNILSVTTVGDWSPAWPEGPDAEG